MLLLISFQASGHLQILYGNLAPEGSVAKITGGLPISDTLLDTSS